MTQSVGLLAIAITITLATFPVLAEKNRMKILKPKDPMKILRQSIFKIAKTDKQMKKFVAIEQIAWDFNNVGIKEGTYGWGQININRKNIIKYLTEKEKDTTKPTYINVVSMASNGKPRWLVENLLVPGVPCGDTLQDTLSDQTPMTTYFSLESNPGTLVSEQIEKCALIIVASYDALPLHEVVLKYISEQPSFTFEVSQYKESTEGAQLKTDYHTGSFSNPPLPVDIESIMKDPPAELFLPLCTFQDTEPNIQCARNQCNPHAISNALAFLENQTPFSFFTWNLNDAHTLGYGHTSDDLDWTADPEDSLVAWVDKYTERSGASSFDNGSGSKRCQQFDGLFKYTKNRLSPGSVSVEHEGGDAKYGKGESCDDTEYDPLQISFRQNTSPTWKWIYGELSAGNAVVMNFGRYDSNGVRTSAHSVRVWGACRFGFSNYLYTLDDGLQGDNNGNDTKGLRTQSWNVKDTGNSAGGDNPGAPDGQMNMNGLDWEIEIAISIRKLPVPIFVYPNFGIN